MASDEGEKGLRETIVCILALAIYNLGKCLPQKESKAHHKIGELISVQKEMTAVRAHPLATKLATITGDDGDDAHKDAASNSTR